jgi:hypothetical protein
MVFIPKHNQLLTRTRTANLLMKGVLFFLPPRVRFQMSDVS